MSAPSDEAMQQPATEIGRLVHTILKALNARPVVYCVLRNYEELPDEIGNDLDIAIARNHVEEACHAVLEAMSACGWSVLRLVRPHEERRIHCGRQKKGGQWRQLTAEHITTVDALCSQITAKTVFCGEFVPSITDELKKQLKQKALILPPAAGLRRASFLAELGLKRFKAGDYDNPTTLQPLYFRGPSITQPKHR